jgi:hypothetical protein
MRRRTLLAIVIILIPVTLSCSFLGGGVEQGPEAIHTPTEPAGAAPTSPPEATTPPEPALPEATPATSTEEPPLTPSGDAVEWDGSTSLSSYREYTVLRDGGANGAALSELTAEWNAETSASWYTVGSNGNVTMEEITIGSKRWTRMGSNPWMEETLTPEEQAAWQSKMSLAQLWGDASEIEEDLESVLPEGIELVPAQIFPLDIKAAMVFDGEETVNGVHCRRYTVDTDLDYTHDMPGGGETHYTGHATGVIWIANRSGIPPIIVRAWMDEVLITDGEESHPYWEHDITSINQPITVEPPE